MYVTTLRVGGRHAMEKDTYNHMHPPHHKSLGKSSMGGGGGEEEVIISSWDKELSSVPV